MPLSGTLYGYGIEAQRPLARLRTGSAPRGRIVLASTTRPPLEEPGEIIEVVEDPASGDIGFAVARTTTALVAWCAVTGGHRIEAAGRRILSETSEDRSDWQDRVVSSLIPLLLVERGELLLHAAAVLTTAGAIVVCGPSGRGKSTLAATLDDLGYPLLTEDIVALTVQNGGVLAWPGPLDARVDARTQAHLATDLSTTAVRGKRLLRAGEGHGADPVRVVGVVSLEPRQVGPMEVHALAPAEAMAWVFPSVLRLEPATWPAAYARAAEIVRRVPCHRARLRANLAATPLEAGELIARIT